MRWKALDEIYKIYMLLHRSDLNISGKFRTTFSHFPVKIAKILYFWLLFVDYCTDFDKILSEFRQYQILENVENLEFFEISNENS